MAGVVGKITIGILGTGSLSVGALGIHSITKPTKLGHKLSWDGLTVLSTDSDTHKEEWERLVKLYEKQENEWKIGNVSLNAPSDNKDHSSNISELKKECQKLFDANLEDSDISNKEDLAKNWCVKDAKGLTKNPKNARK